MSASRGHGIKNLRPVLLAIPRGKKKKEGGGGPQFSTRSSCPLDVCLEARWRQSRCAPEKKKKGGGRFPAPDVRQKPTISSGRKKKKKKKKGRMLRKPPTLPTLGIVEPRVRRAKMYPGGKKEEKERRRHAVRRYFMPRSDRGHVVVDGTKGKREGRKKKKEEGGEIGVFFFF